MCQVYKCQTIRSKPKPEKTSKKRKSKKRVPEKRLLEQKADKLVREIVFLRDVSCICPPPKNGHSEVLQPGHLITRGRKYIRWSLINVHCQCSSCNLLHEHYAEIYTKWFILEFGPDEYMKLVEDSGRIANLHIAEMRTLCEELEKILAYQKENPNWRPYFRQVDIISGEWKNTIEEKTDEG